MKTYPSPQTPGADKHDKLPAGFNAGSLHSTVNEGIVLLNIQGEIVEANAAFCDLLGYTNDELAKLNLADWDKQWIQGVLFAKLGESISHPLLFETRLRCKNGTLLDVEMNGVGMLIDDKKYFYAAARDITYRKQAAVTLINSETRYRRLFESAKEGILILDAETGIITDVNPFLLELSGYIKEQLAEREIWQVDFLGDTIASRESFIQLQQKQYNGSEDCVLKTAGGTLLDIALVSNLYQEGNKKTVQLTIRPLVNKMQAAALQHSEESLRRAHAIAKIASWEWYPDTDTIKSSPEMFSIFGITGQYLNGSFSSILTSIVHPDDLEQVKQSIEQSIQLGTWQPNEHRIIRPDKQIRWIKAFGELVFYKGKLIKILGLSQDITEQKNASLQQQEALSQLNRIAEQVPGGLYQYRLMPDGSTYFPYASGKLFEIFGISTEAVKQDASSLFAKIHPDDIVSLMASMEISIKNLSGWQQEYRLLLDDGTTAVLYGSSMPVAEPGGSILWSGFIQDITKRKMEEQIKYDAVNRLQKIASQLPGVIFQFRLRADGSYSFPYASEAVKDVIGIDCKEVIKDANKAFDTLHPEDSVKIFKSIQTSALNMAPWQQELRIVLPDGTIRTLYGNAIPQREFDESTIWHGFITDITDRKNAAALLEETQNRFKKIARLVPGVIYQYRLKPDGSSSLPYISDLFYKLYKGDHEKVIRNTEVLLENIHPDDRQAFLASVAESAKKMSPWQLEFRIQLDDKKMLTVSGSSIPQREADGSILWSGLITDITELSQAKEKIYQLSQAMEQSPVSVLITDTKGVIQYVNKKFTQTTGYSFEEAVNKNPRFLKTGLTPPEEYRQLWKTLMAGEVWQGEFYNKKKNGDYYWESSTISPVLNTRGEITQWLSVEEDITERKEAGITLQEYATSLKSSNDDLVNFAFVASHDLQEPLRMVSSFLKLLEKKLEGRLDETTQKYIDLATDGARRMKVLIDDLLQYSRVGKNVEAFTAIDLNEMLQYIQHLLVESIAENKAVLITEPMPVIRGNKILLNELFLNLVTNALKYRGKKDPEIEIGYKEENPIYTFYVRDNGIGIAAEDYDKIFVIFQRLHGKGQFTGSGIGLALCKKIVEIHKGKIWVASELGKGSTFYFTIPK